MNVTQEIEQAQAGCLVTQIAPVEFKELLVQLIDKSLDLETLCHSDRKKDRIRAKKLLLLSNLIQASPALLMRLLNTEWETLFFRSIGNGIIDAELKIGRHEKLVKTKGIPV